MNSDKWNRKRRISKVILIILFFLLSLTLNGCGGKIAHNVSSEDDIMAGQKILAGRFICYDNEKLVNCKESASEFFSINVNEDKSPDLILLMTDENDYFYGAFPEGQYNFSVISRWQTWNNPFNFPIDPMPTVQLYPEDEIVNLGTLELRFSQSLGSKVGAFFAYGRAYLKVNSLSDHDTTAEYLATHLDHLGMDIRNAEVVFKSRAKQITQVTD